MPGTLLGTEPCQSALDPALLAISRHNPTADSMAAIRPPISVTSGGGQRYNAAYERCGVPEAFLFAESLCGWRRTVVTYEVRCDVIRVFRRNRD